MGFLFGKPKEVKPPPPLPPPAVPDVGPETREQARRKRPRGRMETFLTGELVPFFEEKKKSLG